MIHGDARGRELGVPTANLALAPGHVLPAQGVYTGVAMLPDDAGLRRAAISVGTNPTFAGERELRIEAHLLDFDGDLYGRPLRLAFRRYLRGQHVRRPGGPRAADAGRHLAGPRRASGGFPQDRRGRR